MPCLPASSLWLVLAGRPLVCPRLWVCLWCLSPRSPFGPLPLHHCPSPQSSGLPEAAVAGQALAWGHCPALSLHPVCEWAQAAPPCEGQQSPCHPAGASLSVGAPGRGHQAQVTPCCGLSSCPSRCGLACPTSRPHGDYCCLLHKLWASGALASDEAHLGSPF